MVKITKKFTLAKHALSRCVYNRSLCVIFNHVRLDVSATAVAFFSKDKHANVLRHPAWYFTRRVIIQELSSIIKHRVHIPCTTPLDISVFIFAEEDTAFAETSSLTFSVNVNFLTSFYQTFNKPRFIPNI